MYGISADYLINGYGYRAIRGKASTRVSSSPNVVCYGKGKFMAGFVFDAKGLRRIILTPIVPGIEVPNYPSEEYQNTKYEYCVSLLRDMYGRESASDALGTYWKKGSITIACSVILGGKDQYSGGDICINFM